MVFLIKKLNITIISKTRIIITFIKFTILVIFVKTKIDIDAKKFMCYNYN